MMKQISILWLRNNLRIHDNVALYEAMKTSDFVLPVYCLQSSVAGPETNIYKRAFVLSALRELNDGLQKFGSRVAVLYGEPHRALAEVFHATNAHQLHTTSDPGVYEERELKALKRSLPASVVAVHHDNDLYHPDDLPFDPERIPPIYTEFRKRCEKYATVRAEVPVPQIKPAPPFASGTPIPDVRELPVDTRSASAPVGGESVAWQRLQHYFWETRSLSSYKETRNGLIGRDYSSKFSAYLATGALSPRRIYAAVKRYENEFGSNQSTYWLIFELIWRDYFRQIARQWGSQLFVPQGLRAEPVYYRKNSTLHTAWCAGKTGVPFIDANMRELKTTGFMSNRGRQVVASYYVKDLQLPWWEGAQWFEETLCDYDVSSNWANWQYVSGVGNDPRENRYFNVLKQARTYDPHGEYVRLWCPEIAHIAGVQVHDLWNMSAMEWEMWQVPELNRKPVRINPKW